MDGFKKSLDELVVRSTEAPHMEAEDEVESQTDIVEGEYVPTREHVPVPTRPSHGSFFLNPSLLFALTLSLLSELRETRRQLFSSLRPMILNLKNLNLQKWISRFYYSRKREPSPMNNC